MKRAGSMERASAERTSVSCESVGLASAERTSVSCESVGLTSAERTSASASRSTRWRFLAGVITSLGLLGLASPATAQDSVAPRSQGESSTIKPVAERKLSAPKRRTPTERAATKKKQERAERVGYVIPQALRATLQRQIDAKITANIQEAKALRNEAIGLLRRFVAESPEQSESLPEALMRLGELEWEDSRDKFLLAFNRWEEAPASRRGEAPTPSYSLARSRFERVLKRHKRYRDYDFALYVDGFLASEEGKAEEALVRFNRILQWFPKSRFVPDAHMVRAESEFLKDAPNYQTAYLEYEEVLKHKDSPLYELALFKSAWCLWRLGKSDEAARRFLAVFRAGEEDRKGRTQAELDELQTEALRNLVAVFVEDEKNSAEDMHRFLVKAGGEQFAGKIVRALAEAFYEQAHFERGVEAYRLLLKLEPTSPEAYRHGLAIAAGHATMQDWKQLRADYRWLIQTYTAPPAKAKGAAKPGAAAKAGAAGAAKPGAGAEKPSAAENGDSVRKAPAKMSYAASPWTQVQRPLTLKDAERAIERQLREDALALHAKAQRDKASRGEWESAAGLYAVYLSRFSDRPEAYDVYFNHAEINFYHLEDGATAAASYMAAVRKNPKGKLSRDALYNALAALERARAAEFEAARAKGEPQRESATDKLLTEALEQYVKTYPEDKDLPELLFRQGKLYYDYAVYDPAVRLWGLLVERYPDSTYAAGAGDLILDSFNKSEDYANIETWARRLKQAPSFKAPAEQARLDTLIVQSVFKQGEQLSAKGEHGSAARAYLRAAEEFPKDARAAKAAVNAEVEARRAADLVTVAAAAALLTEHHKGTTEAGDGLWIAAETFQSVGLFSEAAGYHEAILKGHPKHARHKDAAYNAVLLRTTIGDHPEAIAAGESFRKAYPRGDDTDAVTFLMGKAHEKAEKWKEAEQVYARYEGGARSASTQVEALVRLATVRVRLKDEKGAKSALAKAVRVGKQKRSQLDAQGKYFMAKARYLEGERILAEYEAIKIEGDVKQLGQRLRKKSDLLKRAAETFLDTAELGVAEWTTAALYQIGYTYESFARALTDSPPPEALSAEEQEIYRQQIDEFVVPIEERAIEAYESGWSKAIELGIFNTWTAKMRDALGRLVSEVYSPMHETGLALRAQGTTPLPDLIGSPRREGGRSQRYLIPRASLGAAGADKDSEADSGGAASGSGRAGGSDPAGGSERTGSGADKAGTEKAGADKGKGGAK
ncbi:MAG: tetratricopeptide repeat protein [Polyangiaceae bacterium]|nr:tetratricopeptide repeat protein [Polyangiaceae bacterium]MCW5789036.1 tetratricopeptide repeat protein [Polyangiaceae bacterium]